MIGECNHRELCMKCSFIIREKNKSIKCVICKTDLNEVFVTRNKKFTFNKNYLKKEYLHKNGIYSIDPKLITLLSSLEEIKCPFKKCSKLKI